MKGQSRTARNLRGCRSAATSPVRSGSPRRAGAITGRSTSRRWPPSSSRRRLALEIGRRNTAAIGTCSLLAAFLDGQEVDAGTAAEVGYAAALGLRCFGLRTDLRQAGEPGVRINLQLESFILESGGTISGTLDELVAALQGAVAGAPARRAS